jgi:hypothetical protein
MTTPDETAPALSPSTIALFEQLLSLVQLRANSPSFDREAAQISTARKELAALKPKKTPRPARKR